MPATPEIDRTVLVADDGSVRTLTLNRPQALNSFTDAMHAELLAALEAAATMPASAASSSPAPGAGSAPGRT